MSGALPSKLTRLRDRGGRRRHGRRRRGRGRGRSSGGPGSLRLGLPLRLGDLLLREALVLEERHQLLLRYVGCVRVGEEGDAIGHLLVTHGGSNHRAPAARATPSQTTLRAAGRTFAVVQVSGADVCSARINKES